MVVLFGLCITLFGKYYDSILGGGTHMFHPGAATDFDPALASINRIVTITLDELLGACKL